MKVNSLFLAKDFEEANKELDCYGICLDMGIAHYLTADFEKAAKDHENIARSLHELSRYRRNKQQRDIAVKTLRQLSHEHREQAVNRLMRYE